MSKTSLSLLIFIAFTIFLSSCGGAEKKVVDESQKPNVILIYLDDSGYSDFEPFEGSEMKTPHIKKLAEEGTVFTNFHVAQAVCSASRSALISGCYPGRTKVFGAHPPKAKGLDPAFATLGQQLKKGGYVTGFYGKWHLGDQEETRPHNRGFDESAGLMYSNDMWKHHPENPEYWGQYPIQYWENGEVIIEDVDSSHQKNLTKWSTEYSTAFIERHKDEPFFLYLAYSMPHVPLFCSEEFEGKSGYGMYGDVIMELDYGIGQVLKKLEEFDLDENTLVLFSSDNGPWSVYGNHAGATPFREAKGTSFEGGTRSACIAKLPGIIPAGEESGTFIFSIDLFPSICELTGSPLPEHEIDGKSILPLLAGEKGATSPARYYAISNGSNFEAVFSSDGKWKLHLPHSYRQVEWFGNDGKPGKYRMQSIDLSLYDMENDPMETENVVEKYPEVANELMGYAREHREKFYPGE